MRSLLILASVVVMSIFGILWSRFGDVSNTQTGIEEVDDIVLGPQIRAITTIELPSQEINSKIPVTFEVGNMGNADLVLSGFELGCSCNDLEVLSSGSYQLINGLVTIPPGGNADFRLNLTIQGRVGLESYKAISFLTNDPQWSEYRIIIHIDRILGGLRSQPFSINAGFVPLNSPQEWYVDLIDPSATTRIPTVLKSTNPKAMQVEFVKAEECVDKPKLYFDDTFVGRVRVRLFPQSPGAIDEKVIIYLEGRDEPTEVSVRGTVSSSVQLSPSTLTLPRNGSNGPVYSGRIICRSPFSKEFKLAVNDIPVGVKASVQSSEPNTLHIVSLEIDPDIVSPGDSTQIVIKFRATFSDSTESVSLPISLTH